MSTGPGMEFLGRVAFEATKMRPLLPTYLHLLLSAIFPIYIAAHASLGRPSSAAKPEKKKRTKGSESEDEDDEVQVMPKIESLTAWDALTFPLLAGATLTSLYFLIKWLEDPVVLNKILAVYFSQMGMFFGAKFLKDMFSTIRSALLPTQYSFGNVVWHVDTTNSCFTAAGLVKDKSQSSPLPGRLRNIPLPQSVSSAIWKLRKLVYAKAKLHLDIHKVLRLRSSIDLLDVLSFIVIVSIVAWQTFVSTPWYLTNFMGFSFCYGSLQMITPTSGWVGTLVLSALFFYDIYFVFFTPMMVTVATKLEVPIKLLFPRPDGCVMPIGAPEGSEAMLEYLECLSKKRTMAMLGLGDIVIPGMMLAFALRFDLYLFYMRQMPSRTGILRTTSEDAPSKPKYKPSTGSWGERFWTTSKLQSAELKAKSFPKPYFHASVFGYLVGMIITMLAMQVAQHAQPALLYLVPGVLLSLWGTAIFRGDLNLLWAYTEDEENEENERKSEEEAKMDTEKVTNEKISLSYLRTWFSWLPGVSLVQCQSPKVTGTEGASDQVGTANEKEAIASKTSTHEKEGDTASEKESNASNTATWDTASSQFKSKPEANSEDTSKTLISFSITLPARRKVGKGTESESSNANIPEPSTKPQSSSTGSRDTEDSYDVLPDIKADHEILDKLSREISRSKEEGPITTDRDGEPAGKRRRKA